MAKKFEEPVLHGAIKLRTIAHAHQKKYSGRHLRPVVGTSIPVKLSTATHEALDAVVQ